jgi:O-methyltransferase
MSLKQYIKGAMNRLGFEIRKIQKIDDSIPDASFYRPYFSPWYGYGEFKSYYDMIKPYTIVSPDRCYVLYSLALQATHLDGEWYECGVYRGGTAMLFASIITKHGQPSLNARLHLFDTFEGMFDTQVDVDYHNKGDFFDTSVEDVRSRLMSVVSDLKAVSFHKGLIPLTFRNLEEHRIAFAYVDVDIYRSVIDCCDFIYPRLQPGGFLIFDDYGMPTCPGARKAIDEFFSDKSEVPLLLQTGQAIVFKGLPKE